MAIAAIPTNVNLQQGNGVTYLSWDIISGATTYTVQRSTDGVTYSTVGSPAVNNYTDSTVTLNTLYYYQVASTNSSGTSGYCSPQNIVPTATGTMALGEVRLRAQQRADRVNSQFVTLPEWNSYINQSYFELYDLLVTLYEDFFVAGTVTITTDGVSQLYALPNGTNYSAAPAFYKMMGVDLGLASNNNAWLTMRKFDFISRNRFVYPQITSTYPGVFNIQYRLMGSNIMFIPVPSANQYFRLWYVPRLTQLLKDIDIMDGVSGWTEYVIIDAAIKALQKEESDVSILMAEKMALKMRIEDSAMNRDVGAPDTISNTRTASQTWGAMIGQGDGSYGGY